MEPEWLDKDFLSSCLQGGDQGASVLVMSYEVQPGVAAGNNYGSNILRVTVNYKTDDNTTVEKSVSLIIKAPVQTNLTDFLFQAYGLAESKFYYTFLPKVREISQVQIAPKTYFTPLRNVVVLEDLKEAGFSMANRHNQLDFDHCRQYLVASATLHAIGTALAKKYPELPAEFPSGRKKLRENEAYAKTVMKTMIVGLNCLVKSIETLNLDEYKSFTESIKTLIGSSGHLLQAGFKCVAELQEGHFKSFIHGDCWTTNMMFRHDASDLPTDIRLIDFQAFNYDTVVSDVINFIWMSANNEVLESRLDELYRVYCDTLNSTLANLGCNERMSYEQLKKEILDQSLQLLLMVGVFLPLTQAEQHIDAAAVFSGSTSEEQMMIYYQGKHFWKKFPCVLKYVAHEGVFDWLDSKCSKWKQGTV